MIDVLIIEDEVRTARELSKMIMRADDSFEIVAVLDSVEQSISWLSNNKQPALIFSDIQLADGLCFDIFSSMQIKSAVIFCTAFDEYMMNAFDTHAISYLLKPISQDKLEKALNKYHAMKSLFEKEESNGMFNLLQQVGHQYKTALLVNFKERIIPVQTKDIAYIFLDTNMLYTITLNNQKYYLSSSLEELERMLDPKLFYRANRQFIINKTAIINVERYFARKLVIHISVDSPEEIIVSKARASDFLNWLQT